MERRFEEELQEVRERLLAMGGLAETMIHKGIKALVERDGDLVQAVLAHEEEMDLRCIELDERCFTLLARWQPMASDLRLLVSAIKINGELERIGDQAVSIALRARSLLAQPQAKLLIDIPRMARLAQEMVRKSLDAFVRRDPDLARAVIEADDEVDSLRDQVFRDLLVHMRGDPSVIPLALDLIMVSRHLERIADHATNIGEDVVYIVRGEDVRERGDKEVRIGLRERGQGPALAPAAAHEAGPRARGLMPEEQEFLQLFEAAAHNLLHAARLLQEMVTDYRAPAEQWRGLVEAEEAGDAITHQIIRKLNQTFIPFIDRRDLHALTSSLDDVVDGIEAAASRMVLYKVEQPTRECRELVALIVASAEQIVKAVTHLPRFDGVAQVCVEINRLENAADDLYRSAVGALFEGERPALEVTKWKEIYEILEAVTDRCEDVADVVEAIALKHS